VVGPEVPGLQELGVVATPVESVVPLYLRRFQSGGGRRPTLPRGQMDHTTGEFFRSKA
jgi:hypothetical protein